MTFNTKSLTTTCKNNFLLIDVEYCSLDVKCANDDAYIQMSDMSFVVEFYSTELKI